MAVASAGVAPPVQKFFEFSLLGLLTSGFLAVVGSGYLDTPTIVITAAALIVRTLACFGVLRFDVPASAVAVATIAYIGFYPIDYFYISRAFIPAAVHLVFFVAVVKIITGRSSRDYLLLKVIAFLELLAACLLSSSLNFFVFLLFFLILGVATFASGEIRQSGLLRHSISKTSTRAISLRLAAAVAFVSAGILVITAGLFFFLPRTARAAFQHFVSHRYHLAGFSNHVTLGEIGEIKKENTPVMHVKMDRREDRGLALKWRGAALSEFNGRAWSNRMSAGRRLRPDPGGLLRLDDDGTRSNPGRHISYSVHLNELATDTLFFAGTPQFLRIDSGVVRRAPGNYSVQLGDARSVSYQVYSQLEPPLSLTPDDDAGLSLSAEDRTLYLQLPRIDPRIRDLSQNIVGGFRTPVVEARLIEDYLRTHYGYTLELPSAEPDDPLSFFLFHRKKGHCEYFASSMAVMLRVLDIPTRVVTGFQSGIYNPISGSQLIRTSDAHSWVEAWIPGRGWTTFDPTPPDPNPPAMSFWTRLSLYLDAADVFWQDWVLNYNLDRQLQLASRMGESSRHVGNDWFEGLGSSTAREWKWFIAFGRRYGFVLSGLLILGLLVSFFGRDMLGWWNTRRRVRRAQRGEAEASDATLLYQRMLKVLYRRGIEKPVWLTPCEFARVVHQPELSPLVENLTDAYNELRFGGNADAAGRMIVLLEKLEAVS